MDKTQGDSNSIANEHAEQAVKNQAMATINTPDNENSASSTVTGEAEVPNLAQRELQPRVPQELNQEVNPEKLEDVFQDEVIKAFVSIAEFKKFARSKDGLKLKDCDVEEICQDNRQYVNEQKMSLLRKWREKMGEDATPERIREIVENYRKKLNVEE